MKKTLISVLILCFCITSNAQISYIKTVVHVLYTSPSNNINDATVINYINQVNLGFSKQQAPVFVRGTNIFDTIWANTNIQLCLATQDPLGSPTNGITHTSISNSVIPVSNPSNPIWTPGQYLNIYLAPVYPEPGFTFVLGGWASTPTNPQMGSTFDYVVVSTNSIPFIPQLLSHEIGHVFGLDHLSSDALADTPAGMENITPAVGYSGVCNSALQNSNTSNLSADGMHWGGIDPPDMVENYMGLSFCCSYMFTKMQRNLMKQYINTHCSGWLVNSCTSTAIKNIPTKQEKIKLYPNPTSGMVNIELEEFDSPTIFSIQNVLGEYIIQGTINQSVNQINVSDLAKGIYFVKVQGNNNLLKLIID